MSDIDDEKLAQLNETIQTITENSDVDRTEAVLATLRELVAAYPGRLSANAVDQRLQANADTPDVSAGILGTDAPPEDGAGVGIGESLSINLQANDAEDADDDAPDVSAGILGGM